MPYDMPYDMPHGDDLPVVDWIDLVDLIPEPRRSPESGPLFP
jgi:hypothetical protein